MPTRIEVYVSEVEPHGDGAHVLCRVGDADIHVGDVFTQVRGLDWRWDATKKEFVPADPGPSHAVELRIDSTEAYGHQLKEMSAGMGCRIRVSGRGVEFLGDGKVLAGEVDRPARRV